MGENRIREMEVIGRLDHIGLYRSGELDFNLSVFGG